MFTILGCPSSIAYWNFGNSFLIADFAHQSIFKRDEQEVEQIHNLITEFNDKAFHGPSSLTISETTSINCSNFRKAVLYRFGNYGRNFHLK
jgi:hypothetical protein